MSDQDNCLILSDAATAEDMGCFTKLATFVSDGLHDCGYISCPGDMMATNPRWCQPLRVWCDRFAGWVAQPDPMAQMRASVMFDLRPIGGDAGLFRSLQADRLEMAARHSIFVAHMVGNSHSTCAAPRPVARVCDHPVGRTQEPHRPQDNGVVPVTDLGRVYALIGRFEAANARAQCAAALDLSGTADGAVSGDGYPQAGGAPVEQGPCAGAGLWLCALAPG